MNTELGRLAVIIPAYKPESVLIGLSEELITKGFHEVIIVDDGSGSEYADIFSALKKMGCRVLSHTVNMGKGRAIKTAINDVLVRGGIDGVVTADADGQHLVHDIVGVGLELLKQPNTIILGKRTLHGKIPFKSRFGNTITRGVFNFVSGQKIHDTQTGLRGMPYAALKDLLSLSGERYEYEMNVLLESSHLNLKLKEVEIETVYINNNSGSHFNPLKDSWRIYRLIIMFGGSSVIAFLIDFLLFALIKTIFPSEGMLWLAVVGARVVSSFMNFLINRNVIFAGKNGNGNLKRHIIGYYLLVVVIMAANYGLLSLFTSAGINVYLAKVITEVMLFFVSFLAQKRIVFK
ncbi:MAG: bifunctional glycosyltransferase family 2/GtrA family protein [Eubacteriales bacterium]|nr:bifunctional glycosyltransferase family 2/GtrA family protein [Eubacteriales bacterium]